MLVCVLFINLVPIEVKSKIKMEPDFDINPVKGEILDYNEFSDENETLTGKILDYQFFVTPKIEQIDAKPEIVKKELDEGKSDVKVLESFENLVRKVKYCPKRKLHFCEHCDFKSNYLYSLKRHNYLHTLSKEHKIHFCEHCDFKTNYLYNLKKHNYLHTLSKEDRKKKTEKENKNKILYSCEHCDFKTYNKTNFETHTEVVHLKTIEYQCQQCDYKTYGKAYLHRHVISVHGNKKQKVFNCNLCGFSSTKLKHLQRHSVIHSGERKYSCDLCLYRARSRNNLNNHKDRIHLKKLPAQNSIVCEICGKEFKIKLNYTLHLVKEHKMDIEVPTYICHTCGYKNINKVTFTAHVLRHVNKTYMYCANCDYKTYTKTNLTQHMVKHMKNVKMHKCTICSFETKRPHTLRHHFKTHLK